MIPHPEFIDEKTIAKLAGFDFVFACVDRPSARKLISDALHALSTPFVDVGMELQLVDEAAHLIGTCRVTLSTPEKRDHLSRHVSLSGGAVDDLYATNIQVADMSALTPRWPC